MTPTLKISEKLLKRLATVIDPRTFTCNFKDVASTKPQLGKLYGILAKNTLVVLGLELQVGQNDDLTYSFPAGVDICGIISIGVGTYDEQQIKNSLGQVDVTDNPIFINYTPSSHEIDANFFINGQLEKSKYVPITEQDILSQFLYVRLVGYVPLSCELRRECIEDAFLQLRKSVASGIMTFHFDNTSIYLLEGNSENGVLGIAANQPISELCSESDPSEGNKKQKIHHLTPDILKINLLKRTTKDEGAPGFKKHAPVCVLDKKPSKTMSCIISIDSLTMLHRLTEISSLYEILVESAIRNLRLFGASILSNLERPEGHISQPEVFHFYPECCAHFITTIYQKDDNENVLLRGREKLHKQLLLSENRPIFRRANSFTFKTNKQGSEPLINPHIGVKRTDNGGNVASVQGNYQYYHYGQNKMDDNGWGCAYRSLQTLASWFKLQGYTDKEVPTFTDIQKCLVDIGDKPNSFVGSRQWIGSTEVNFVLDTLLGITCKILYVSSGEEMASKGPELINHFDVHGSPIMIGGGVLAHTILGVDYNSQTGSLKFLILDPHYAGAEDLRTVQNKGWCGWKGVDFWDKSAYYNMCLPQVPAGL